MGLERYIYLYEFDFFKVIVTLLNKFLDSHGFFYVHG